MQVESQGIDVTVFHPSPVASNFASSADHQIDILDLFSKLAVPPEALPNAMFGAMGRCVYRDFGPIALIFRLMSKLVDYNLLAWATAASAHTMPDFKRHWQAAEPAAGGGGGGGRKTARTPRFARRA
jgi:short-subunit dehydrogenase